MKEVLKRRIPRPLRMQKNPLLTRDLLTYFVSQKLQPLSIGLSTYEREIQQLGRR